MALTRPRLTKQRSKSNIEESLSPSFPLTDLPVEILERILGYLPLTDLSNARTVCSSLYELIDGKCAAQLWANAPLDGLWLSPPDNTNLMFKACAFGNVEVSIMLAFAHLYAEGSFPQMKDRGQMIDFMSEKAAALLVKVECLIAPAPPLVWAIIRPPWARSCFKSATWSHLNKHCKDSSDKEAVARINYSLGRAMAFHRRDLLATAAAEEPANMNAMQWFMDGAEVSCPYSTLEVWKIEQKPNLSEGNVQPVRCLREVLSLLSTAAGRPGRYCEASFELCSCYARGFYGGYAKEQALKFVRQTFASSVSSLVASSSSSSSTLPRERRYILVDWLIEVVTMKDLPASVLHMAMSLTDVFLKRRPVERTKLQLLGITAILLASRWMGESIVSVREATWFTDHTYTYDQVVRMMGHIVASLHGDIRRSNIYDYLLLLFSLLPSKPAVVEMATFLSEAVLLHSVFGGFPAAKLAASCFLSARVLHGTECPWPSDAVLATGFTLEDLQTCCITVYERCLTDRFDVIDQRNVKLDAVHQRHSIKIEDAMSCSVFKEHLGAASPARPLITPTPRAKRRGPHHQPAALSFLSDSSSSAYQLTSPFCKLTMEGSTGSSQRHSSSSSSGSSSRNLYMWPQEELGAKSPQHEDSSFSLSSYKSPKATINVGRLSLSSSSSSSSSSRDAASFEDEGTGSNFPQPAFSDCELSPSFCSSSSGRYDACPLNESILEGLEGEDMEIEAPSSPRPALPDRRTPDEQDGSDNHPDEELVPLDGIVPHDKLHQPPFNKCRQSSQTPSSSRSQSGGAGGCHLNGIGFGEAQLSRASTRGSENPHTCHFMEGKAVAGPGLQSGLTRRSALQRLENIQQTPPLARSTPQSGKYKSRQKH